MRHERGGGTGLLLTGRSPGSSPCCRRRHSLRRAADPSSRDTVAPAVDNALLHRSPRRRSRPRPRRVVLAAPTWIHLAPVLPRQRASTLCTASEAGVPHCVDDARSSPGLSSVPCLTLARRARGSPSWTHQKKRSPTAATSCPSGTASSSSVIGPFSSSSRGCFRSKCLCSSSTPRAFAAEASRSSHARCVRGSTPFRAFSLRSPLRDHDGPMTPLHRPSQQRCSGGTPPAVPVSLRRLSAAGSPCPPAGFDKGVQSGFPASQDSRETASPPCLLGDSSEHSRDATGTPIRRRPVPVSFSESRACPPGVSPALRLCCPDVAPGALRGLACAGVPGGVSQETQTGRQWDAVGTPMQPSWITAGTAGVSEASSVSTHEVAGRAQRRTASAACARSPQVEAQRRLAGVPAGTR